MFQSERKIIIKKKNWKNVKNCKNCILKLAMKTSASESTVKIKWPSYCCAYKGMKC